MVIVIFGAIITNNTFRYKSQLRGELGNLELIRFESGSQFPASGPWIGAHFSEAQFPQGRRRAGRLSSEHQLVLRRDLAQTKPELAWCLELQECEPYPSCFVPYTRIQPACPHLTTQCGRRGACLELTPLVRTTGALSYNPKQSWGAYWLPGETRGACPTPPEGGGPLGPRSRRKNCPPCPR